MEAVSSFANSETASLLQSAYSGYQIEAFENFQPIVDQSSLFTHQTKCRDRRREGKIKPSSKNIPVFIGIIPSIFVSIRALIGWKPRRCLARRVRSRPTPVISDRCADRHRRARATLRTRIKARVNRPPFARTTPCSQHVAWRRP